MNYIIITQKTFSNGKIILEEGITSRKRYLKYLTRGTIVISYKVRMKDSVIQKVEDKEIVLISFCVEALKKNSRYS